MSKCGIWHIETASYNPQTNSEAERYAQTLKKFIKRADHDRSMTKRQFEAILNFLMTYTGVVILIVGLNLLRPT